MIHSVRCACICVYFVIYVYNVSDGKQEAATIEKEELKKALRFSEIYIAGEELGRGFLRVDPHARALMNFGAVVLLRCKYGARWRLRGIFKLLSTVDKFTPLMIFL